MSKRQENLVSERVRHSGAPDGEVLGDEVAALEGTIKLLDRIRVEFAAKVLRVLFEAMSPIDRQDALGQIGYHAPCGRLDTQRCQCDNDE